MKSWLPLDANGKNQRTPPRPRSRLTPDESHETRTRFDLAPSERSRPVDDRLRGRPPEGRRQIGGPHDERFALVADGWLEMGSQQRRPGEALQQRRGPLRPGL